MFKRILLFSIGIITLAFGVVLNTKTNLGVPSMSSVPYVLSTLSSLTLGQTTMFMYILYVVSQTFLLKKITLKVILQIPFSFFFGTIVDLFDSSLKIVPTSLYFSFFYLILAIIITSLGAYLVVTMNLVLNPPDGIVNTLAEVSHREFGQVKFFFDCSMVALSLIISYIFTHQFTGFGIGTIASALLVGKTISIFQKIFEKYPNIM